MTHVYERVDNALYGHKGELMECFEKIELDPNEIIMPMWNWDDVTCSNKLVWMYPPERPPHDAATYLRKLSRDRHPNEAFTAYLKIYTGRGGTRYRTYTAPPWLREKLEEYTRSNSVDRHAGRGQRAQSRGYMIAVDVGKRRAINDLYAVRDIYIN